MASQSDLAVSMLQSVMGWQDCHMPELSAGHRHFGTPNPEDRHMGMPPVENERTVRFSSVLGRIYNQEDD